MNTYYYQKLYEFSLKLNPTEFDFPNKIIQLIMEEFEFLNVELNLFSGTESPELSVTPSEQVGNYQKDVLLLKNQQSEYIGILFLFQIHTNHSHSAKMRSLIDEIGKVVEKALQIHLNYYHMKTNASLYESLLNQLPIATILCNSNFHILHMNQEAFKALDLCEQMVTYEKAETLLTSKVLPIYINSGLDHYSIYLNNNQLQVSIKNLILNNNKEGQYITCYQITIHYIDTLDKSEWMNYLKSKELTSRECEIANLMRLGNTNDEIAARLYISINTMKRHRERIYKKLNINRINQLNILYETYLNKE